MNNNKLLKYYHINHNSYPINAIINAGSMGHYIYNYILYGGDDDKNLLWRLFQEQTFELIRRVDFSNKPSRYNSIFLFDDIDVLNNFINKDNREGTNIYQVEISDSSKTIHRASMKLYERIPLGRPVLLALEDQARQYWSGVNIIDSPDDFWPEILVESDVIVKKIISNTLNLNVL